MKALDPHRSDRHRRRWLRAAVCLGALAALPARRPRAAEERFRLPPLALRLAYPANGGVAVVHHDASTLTALGSVQVTTTVPWNSEPHVWEGVPIRRLLSAVAAVGRPIRLKALNDYEARIPWIDLERYDPILAWHVDGQPIPMRAKGPLIVIYPFSAFSELRRAEYTDRSVWHVSEIIVE